MAASCWADLPPEILLSIAQRLNLGDVIRLRPVCFNWALALGKKCGRSIQPSPQPSIPIFQLSPWLLLPIAPKEGPDSHNFYSVFENRSYRIPSLLQIHDRHFVGSSPDGWLVAIDILYTPRLLNPLTRQELSLPSLLTISINSSPIFSTSETNESLELLKKIILTLSPLQGGVAVAFIKNFLSFATKEDEEWSPILALKQSTNFFEDVVYREEDRKLYALTNQGAVYIIERTENRSWDIISMVAGGIDNRQPPLASRRRSIIFSCGDLLQVTRDIILEYTSYSNYFKVFKFDRNCFDRHEKQKQKLPPQSYGTETESDPQLCPHATCWVPVEDLGDRFLFVGSNNSFALHCVGDELSMMRKRVAFTGDMVSQWLERNACEPEIYKVKNRREGFIFNFDYYWPPHFWFMPAPTLWDED